MVLDYKIRVFTALVFFTVLGTAWVRQPVQKKRNLKVLPQDISDEMLDSIMHSFNKALGVECNFCHVPAKGFKDSLDYASDDEPMKEEARKMMTMVIDINKKYFWYDKKQRPEYLKTVTCMHCHRGEPYPEVNH
ncbi:MAG: c-type cytochrome [Chitinophagaceae bacterium]|nr:c-type cytochrome [Chitinophagaceae bacterium]